MRRFIFLAVMTSFWGASLAHGQTYLPEPVCFKLINHAPYSVRGHVSTAPDKTDAGIKAPHRSNFSLKENDSIPVCTTGPLFDGEQIRLTLSTLFPVFECKTRIWPGAEIIIQGQRKEEGGTETWVECY